MMVITLLSGCNRVTEENYERLAIGMSLNEVESIIGKAGKCNEQYADQNCLWGNKKKYIRAMFTSGRLVSYYSEGLAVK